MKRFACAALLSMLLGLGCTPEAPADASRSESNDSIVSSSPSGGGPGKEPALPEQQAPTYPVPDPFVGTYANDPSVEGFDRTVAIDSIGPNRYRVRLVATESDGTPLCRHTVTCERVDTLELAGRLEGSELRIRSQGAALFVTATAAELVASPGLLCPGASIFGWLLPQWTRAAATFQPYLLVDRESWIAPTLLRDFNAAQVAAGRPERQLRYEAAVLTRGDFDRDERWDFAALLRDTTGRTGVYLRRNDTPANNWQLLELLPRDTSTAATPFANASLTTVSAGTSYAGATAEDSLRLAYPGIVLRQYATGARRVLYRDSTEWQSRLLAN